MAAGRNDREARTAAADSDAPLGAFATLLLQEVARADATFLDQQRRALAAIAGEPVEPVGPGELDRSAALRESVRCLQVRELSVSLPLEPALPGWVQRLWRFVAGLLHSQPVEPLRFRLATRGSKIAMTLSLRVVRQGDESRPEEAADGGEPARVYRRDDLLAEVWLPPLAALPPPPARPARAGRTTS